MKALSDCKMCQCLTAWGKKLSRLQLRGDYQMTLGVYEDEQSDSAQGAHRCDGSLSCSLWKLLAVLGGICLAMAMLRALCGLLSRLSL